MARQHSAFARKLEAELDQGPVRVSYAVVTRNRSSHLRALLANVREFIEPEDELIVVDGGSTDETA